MEPNATQLDPWRQILLKLSEARVPAASENAARAGSASLKTRRAPSLTAGSRARSARFASFSTCVTIKVVERSERIARITWYDPTSCHYAEQRWHRTTSLRSGTCALTGVPIARGDDIFRPSRADRMNARAMILTCKLPEVHGLDPVLKS
jgi:Domain of unknown function (DUF3331)